MLCLLLVVPAAAQKPSAKSLRETLGAKVSRYDGSGRFIASWSLADSAQLEKGFSVEGGKARISSKSLLLDARGGIAAVKFRELGFKPPFRIEFEFKLEKRGASLISSEESAERLFAFANTVVYSNEPSRMTGLWRIADGKPHASSPEARKSRLESGKWLDFTLEVDKKGRPTGSIAGTPVELGAWPRSPFHVMIGSYADQLRVRNLKLDTKVDVASVRKLVRGISAREETGNKRKRRNGFAILEVERGLDVYKALRPHLEQLSPAAASLTRKGMTALSDGRPARALSSLRNAAAQERSRKKDIGVALPYLTGLAWRAQGNAAQARAAWVEATRPAPGFSKAWTGLALIHLEEGSLKDAFECADKAIAADPKDPWPHLVRSEVLVLRGDLQGAESEIKALKEKRKRSRGADVTLAEFQQLRAPPDWKKTFTKKNEWYEIKTNISSKLAADFQRKLLHYRRFLEEHFPLPEGARAGRSKVWIFDSEGGYHAYANTLGTSLEHSEGVYHSGLRTLMLIGRLSRAETQDTLFHEAFHQYLHTVVDRAPIWFNEGLAEYYGATEFGRTNMRPTAGAVQKGRLRNLRSRKDRLVPFDRLMRMSPREFMNPDDAAFHYAQSWAMVHFFKHGGTPAWRNMFREYTSEILRNAASKDAFETAFGSLKSSDWVSMKNVFLTYVGNL